MGRLWDDFGMILGWCWDDVGMIWGWCLDDLGMILGWLWCDVGEMLVWFGCMFKSIFVFLSVFGGLERWIPKNVNMWHLLTVSRSSMILSFCFSFFFNFRLRILSCNDILEKLAMSQISILKISGTKITIRYSFNFYERKKCMETWYFCCVSDCFCFLRIS